MIRKMKRLCLLVVSALLLVLTVSAVQSKAGVNVQIYLPPIGFAAPPEVVVIPGTYVYMVPGMNEDVLFFQGYWWRPYEGHWYRSRTYNGRWRHMEPERMPRELRGLPQDYRHRISPEFERIPHKEVKKNWKKWEKEKHWERRSEQAPGEHDRGRHEGRQDREGGRRY